MKLPTGVSVVLQPNGDVLVRGGGYADALYKADTQAARDYLRTINAEPELESEGID